MYRCVYDLANIVINKIAKKIVFFIRYVALVLIKNIINHYDLSLFTKL